MKKFWSMGLSLILAVSLFAGCTAKTSEKTFKVGLDDAYPPMEFKADNGKDSVGFDVELAGAISKKLNMKLELMPTAWSGIFQALTTDKFDAIISSVSINEERLQAYTMSKPYIANAQVIIVKPDNTAITAPKDLNGKNVGVQLETTADSSCEDYQKTGVAKFKELKKYETVLQPFDDLKAGRLDAVVVDEVVARYYVKLSPKDYKIVGERLTNEPIGICFKKGNTELQGKVQKALDELRADGTLKTISEKWFGSDLVSDVPQK